MTSLERCLTVLAGGIPDRVPVVPQSFLFSLQDAGLRMRDVVRNPGLMAEALARTQDKFGYDGCVIDFDDATLAESIGARVIYRDDDPAVVDEEDVVVKDLRDIDRLRLPDPWRDGRLPVWLETTQRLIERVGDHVFVMGRADQGPFSLACLLRGTQQFMMDLMDENNHKPIHQLLEFCRQAGVRFAKAQMEAGAHATSIGDALAGPNLISPRFYRQFAFEPERRLVEELNGILCSVHICGNTSGIIDDMGRTGARLLEVDWQLDLAAARALLPSSTVLMGNLNPSDPLVFGTPEQVYVSARKLIKAADGRGLFLSSGCAMGRNTPPENMKALVAAAR